ncbi:hypothetical protein [Proteus mirabilis]|uniref:hypothetical protein n=1 Tax=Proteus mirabilis TaxID=584 RepID=UPI0036B0E70D
MMRGDFGQGVREWAQDFWHEILFPFFVTAGLLFPLILVVGAFLVWDEQRQAERGRYYLTECQLLERNRDTGFWSGRENILQCGVTREHVNADAYEKAIRIWQQKQAETES